VVPLANTDFECEKATKSAKTPQADQCPGYNECGARKERRSDGCVLNPSKKWTDCALYHVGEYAGTCGARTNNSDFCERNAPIQILENSSSMKIVTIDEQVSTFANGSPYLMSKWRIRSFNVLRTTSLLEEVLGGVSDTCTAVADESMNNTLRRDIFVKKVSFFSSFILECTAEYSMDSWNPECAVNLVEH
jgi:hypothetical protein